MQSDLEFADSQDIVGVAKILISHRNRLDVHAEYNHQLPKALKKIEELKATEPKAYNLITVGYLQSHRRQVFVYCTGGHPSGRNIASFICMSSLVDVTGIYWFT